MAVPLRVAPIRTANATFQMLERLPQMLQRLPQMLQSGAHGEASSDAAVRVRVCDISGDGRPPREVLAPLVPLARLR